MAQVLRARRLRRTDPVAHARLRQERRSRRWQRALPLFVAVFLLFTAIIPIVRVEMAIGLVLLIPLLNYLAKRPETCLVGLIIYLPLNPIFFRALPFSLGVPVEIVRQSNYIKEVFVIALAIAAFRKARSEHHGVDVLDRLAFLYIALGAAYVALPELFVNSPVGLARSLFDRVLGFRTDVIYVVIFLAARHVRLTSEQLKKCLQVLLWVALLCGVLAVIEFVASDAWNDFLVNTLRFAEAERTLARRSIVDVTDVRTFSPVGDGTRTLRLGGTLVSFQHFSFFMLVVVAMASHAMSRVATSRTAIVLALAGFSVIATQTRSATIAAAIVLALALLPRKGVDPKLHVRFLVVAGAALVVAIPLAFASGVTDRLTGAPAASQGAHLYGRTTGFATMLDNPLGTGLATAAGAGQRLEVAGAFITENQYLQIGIQLGILGMALMILFYVAALVRLFKVGRAHGGAIGATASGAFAALGGLALVGWYLQPLISFAGCWIAFALAGAAIGASERERSEEPGATGEGRLSLPRPGQLG